MVNLVKQLERKPGAKTNALSNSPVGKIIVVDDELELKNILVEALSAQGFEVTSCNSGQQALEELRHKEFDLLLTDLMMPEMDGIALLEAAAMIDPHLIGIMMTGQGSIQTAVDAMKLGAFDYILKPFRMQSVMPVLTRAINTRRLRMENLQLRETVAIYGLCQTISFTLDPQTVLSRLADAALEQSDADEVSILLPTNDGTELYVAAVRGEKRERLLGERIPLQQSISSWVARERLPLILNGKVQDERFVALWPRADIRSAVSVPMQVANKLVGIINLNVINRLRPFTLGQMKALTILSSTAAAALESASLYAQLQTTEEKYRSIFENATEGLFQSTSDGRLLTANPALARILGYDSPEEMIATITDLAQQLYANPEDRAEAGRLQEERGALEGFELQAYRKDGEKFWLSLNRRSVRNQDGEELYFEGSIENISERKRAEEERAQLTAEIENQRQRLNNIVASVPGVVWEAWGQPDTETQRINFVNDFVETMLGYTVEEWLSTSNFWLTIVHPDDKEEAGRVAGEAFASGKSSSQEFRWITKDGRAIWVESNYVVIKDDEGRPAGLRGVTIDIAGRKRAEETQARRAAHALFRADVSAALAMSGAPLPATLESCVTAMVEHLGAAFARIWTLNREEKMLELQASVGMYTHLDGPHSRVPVGSFKIGKIAEERAPHITNEVQTDPRVGDKEWARREGMVAFAGYPLLVENRMLGVMAMFSRKKLPEDTLDALASVADLISQGIERKRAEEELRESEERYRLLFESSPQPMWVYDLETLAFLAVNESAVHHYGYSREDFLAMTIKDIRPAEDLPTLYDSVTRSSEGVDEAGVWRHLKKDGAIIEVEITSHLLVFDARRAELILANDITERKRGEQALRDSEARKRAILESSMDGVITVDQEGLIVDWNPAAEKAFAYTYEEAVGKDMAELIIPLRYREHHRRGLARYLETGKARVLGNRLELSALRADGTEFPVELTITRIELEGDPMFTGYLRDITDRKEAERRLAAQYAATRALAESNTISEGALKTLKLLCESLGWEYGALWTIEAAQGVLRCAQLWSGSRTEPDEFEKVCRTMSFAKGIGIPGRVWKDNQPLWISEVTADDKFPRSAVAAKAGFHSACGFPIPLRSEVVGVVEFFSRSSRKPDPALLAMMATIGSQLGQFIERKRVETALADSEDQLRQSQKLEAIGQLAGGVAHDFNNLLTVIGGYSSILLNKLEQDSPLRLSVEEIKKASDRAAGLTRQLLAFSRKQILQPKILDLNVIVSDLEKMVRRLIGEDIDLLAITDPNLGKVKADPGQLEQVLLNLIVNARDAMPSGGRLTIETANAILSPDYAHSHGAPGGPYLMLAVSDTGCGMSTELQKHVFEPFFTTKVPGKGTGLGLATVYGIVKQSDGHIWLYSEVGKGTCFKIYLPRVDEIGPDQVNTGGLRLVPKGTETLLLVEDEDQVRQIVKAILEQQGYDVLSAANGEEALKLAELHGSKLHLLMTDLVMPQMSGRELAEQLSTALPDLKVLYMSGYTDDAIVRHGLLDASLSFIQKPFDAATAARKVREVLDSPVR